MYHDAYGGERNSHPFTFSADQTDHRKKRHHDHIDIQSPEILLSYKNRNSKNRKEKYHIFQMFFPAAIRFPEAYCEKQKQQQYIANSHDLRKSQHTEVAEHLPWQQIIDSSKYRPQQPPGYKSVFIGKSKHSGIYGIDTAAIKI